MVLVPQYLVVRGGVVLDEEDGGDGGEEDCGGGGQCHNFAIIQTNFSCRLVVNGYAAVSAIFTDSPNIAKSISS